jgi:hypothetical protein
MSERTFVGAVLDGNALVADVDDWVDVWHESTVDLGDLHVYLGMTWEEYQLWTEQPTALRFILAAHRAKASVGSVQLVGSLAAAAARAENETEAAQVVEWLRKTGRISEK